MLEEYLKKTEPEYYPPVENLLDLIYGHYTENNLSLGDAVGARFVCLDLFHAAGFQPPSMVDKELSINAKFPI